MDRKTRARQSFDKVVISTDEGWDIEVHWREAILLIADIAESIDDARDYKEDEA